VSPGVITACVEPATNQLFYSSDGTCTAGQTTVQWNMQGPQGQTGPTGAQGQTGLTGPQGPAGQSGSSSSSPVVAWGPSSYTPGFTISTEIDNPGRYVADGSVDAAITPSSKYRKSVVAICTLFTGPPGGTATEVAQWRQTFLYHKATKTFTPSSLSGPVDINSGLSLARTDVPLEVYFSCRGFIGAVWKHPQITIEAATNTSFHSVVGPALPVKPVIGPGPIEKVLGTH
jgi:hypothetical protein